MKGILIYPPNQLMNIEIPKPDGSLGLLYLASSLEQNGIETDILDANVGTINHSLSDTLFNPVLQSNGLYKIGMSFEEIAEHVKDYDFVGLTSNFTPQTRMVIETAKHIKKVNPNIKIYCGGVNGRALKYRFLESGYFDGICLTEGELIFPKMLLEGIEKTPGWIWNNGENPITKECFPNNLDELPMPSWEKLNTNYDIRDVTDPYYDKSAAILTSRGCVFRCLYCHNSGEKYINQLRLHSLDRVIEEVKYLKNMNIKKIYIEDESLLAIKSRIIKLFKLLENEHSNFLFPNGINLLHLFDKDYNIDIEYLELLRNAGLYQFAFPIESGSQRILNKYCKGKVQLDKMNIIELMKIITQMGIKTAVNIIIGFPDETEEEIYQSIGMGRKLKDSGAFYVSFFLATPFPGSKFYDMAISNNNIQSDFNPDDMNWKKCIMKNTKVHPERLQEIRDKANEGCNDKSFIDSMISKTVGQLI